MFGKFFDKIEEWIWGENATLVWKKRYDEAQTLIAVLKGKLSQLEEKKEKNEIKNTGVTLQIYKDKIGNWRWRLRAANKKIVAESGEGYKRLSSLEKSLKLVRSVMPIVNLEKKKTP